MSPETDDDSEGELALEAVADACIESWSAWIATCSSTALSISSEGVEAVDAGGEDGDEDDADDASAEDEVPSVLAFAPGKGDFAGLHLVLQQPDALALHALLSGRAAEAAEEARALELGEAMLREIEAQLAHSLEALATPLQEAGRLDPQPSLPSVVVRDARTLAAWIAGPAERLRLALAPEGGEPIHADVYLAEVAPPDDVQRAAASLVVVAPARDVRAQLGKLEHELGRSVRWVEPTEVPHDFAAYRGAAGFVVAWDQGRCAGIDVVEQIRAVRALASRPVAMASASPTRAMVHAALRAGASSFVHLPLDADELRARLFAAGD